MHIYGYVATQLKMLYGEDVKKQYMKILSNSGRAARNLIPVSNRLITSQCTIDIFNNVDDVFFIAVCNRHVNIRVGIMIGFNQYEDSISIKQKG